MANIFNHNPGLLVEDIISTNGDVSWEVLDSCVNWEDLICSVEFDYSDFVSIKTEWKREENTSLRSRLNNVKRGYESLKGINSINVILPYGSGTFINEFD